MQVPARWSFGKWKPVHSLDAGNELDSVRVFSCSCTGIREIPPFRLLKTTPEGENDWKKVSRTQSDITGRRFGRLTAVSFVSRNEKHQELWMFRCDCGKEKIMPAAYVKWGGVKSCGCLLSEHASRLKKQDITGYRYGRLTAVRATEKRDSSGSVIWECHCDCGNTVFYSVNRLSQGRTKSCGCLYAESRENCGGNRSDAVDGTYLGALTASKSLRSNNTSGVTGVAYDRKHECWIAYINIQKKRIYLGQFRSRDDAVLARKNAEKQFHDPILQEHWDALSPQAREKYLAYGD